MAHLRNKWRSGDVWVERSANYRKFDSYMLPAAAAAPIAAELKLPAIADEWFADRGRELDWRLKRFAHGLARGKVEGVMFTDGKLSIAPVRADESAADKALAARIDGLMPRVRITELLHEVARATRFSQAFLNLRTREQHDRAAARLKKSRTFPSTRLPCDRRAVDRLPSARRGGCTLRPPTLIPVMGSMPPVVRA